MPKTPKYFMYFPGNYRWSAAFVNMLGRGSYGGADISELHKIGRLLEGKDAEDDDAWFDACATIADEVRAHAERFRASNHPVSAARVLFARLPLLSDGRALSHAEGQEGAGRLSHRGRLLSPASPGSPTSRSRSSRCRSKARTCRDISFMPGMRSQREHRASSSSTVSTSPRRSSTSRGVPDLIKRGISVLVMDGPGTGEAIRFRGLVLRHDYEKAGSACIDFLERRADVDPKKIGIVAISLGGYYAPRCAALEPRFAACIAWGAIWDYHAMWKRRIEAQFKASLSVPGHHIMWIVGAATLEEALKRLEPFKLDGVVQKMRCPFLVVHGADDEQIPLADAQALYDACGSKDKTLRVFTSRGRRRAALPARLPDPRLRHHVGLVRGQAGAAGLNLRERQTVATMMASPSAVRLTLSPQARASRPA